MNDEIRDPPPHRRLPQDRAQLLLEEDRLPDPVDRRVQASGSANATNPRASR
ncbi:MAG: hypothetical protein U0841_23335 [Chloroflexia bacterium]